MAEIQALEQFGRIGDFVRTIFTDKINSFFRTSSVSVKVREIPIIEKYEITDREGDQFSTSLNIVRYFPDIFEKLPLVAVTTTGNRGFPMTVGFPELMSELGRGRIYSSKEEPYVLAAGDNLVISIDGRKYDVVFYAESLPNFSTVSIDDLKGYLEQIIGSIKVGEEDNKLFLYDSYGRSIQVDSGSAVSKLGFVDGQTPDVTKAYKFWGAAEQMDVIVSVAAADRNQRVEIMDILSDFFGFYVFEEYVGNWVTKIGQIVFRDRYIRLGESDTPMDGDPDNKLYVDSVSIPVSAFVYLPRISEDKIEEINLAEIGMGVVS